MSEDNARWLQLYLHAHQSTGDQFYAEISRGILQYVNTWLSDRDQGCFFGSQDADEEYYKLSKAERLKEQAPYVDKHIYTNWNAMMISAYLEASYILGDSEAKEFALKSINRLLSLNLKEGQGMYHFYDGQPRLQNQLIDQAQTANALIHAYECTGERKFLNQAEEIIRFTSTRLRDPDQGGFFDTALDANAPGFLSRPVKPLDENSVTARALTRLYHLTGNSAYRELAEETLKCFAETYLSFGFMSAEYALAVDAFLNEPTMIQIVGCKDRPETKGFLAEAARIYEPRKIIRILDPDTDAERIADGGFSAHESPTAYICVGTACSAPITEPREVASAIQKMVRAQIRK
jgi:hypothetical protein